MRTLATGFVALVLLFAGAPARAAPSDEFLAGYVSAILEQELKWTPGSYRARVQQGAVTITLVEAKGAAEEKRQQDARIDQAQRRLGQLRELRSVQFIAPERMAAAPVPGFWRGIGERTAKILGVSGEADPFPNGDVFKPLLADEKQPQFFVSLRHYDTPQGNTTLGAVAYGETFGLLRVRSVDNNDHEGLQFSVAGALFAQFDLESPSSDLVNADYTVGVQATYRRNATGARVRLYHQSSHLGDEFLLRVQPERINLSYESLEALVSRQWNEDRWRAYAGGEYLLRREPDDLKPGMLHAGIEYYGREPLLLNGRFVAGVDLKSYEENDWSVDRSIKLGLQFGGLGPGGRHVRLLGEGYRGFAPHGQFYNQKVDYLGLGLYLGF
jgi:hypothetical protein